MKEIFASADYGLVGLLFFFAFFILVALWTFRPGAKGKYTKNAHIPFQENE